MRKFATNKNSIILSNNIKNYIKIYNDKANFINLKLPGTPLNRKALSSFQKSFMTKKDLRNYYDISSRNFEFNTKSLIQTILGLEKRLDILMIRMNLASSLKQCRQLIRTKKVLVNNKIVKSANYSIQIGDMIEVKQLQLHTSDFLSYFYNSLDYLEVNYKLGIGIFLREPKKEELNIPLKIH